MHLHKKSKLYSYVYPCRSFDPCIYRNDSRVVSVGILCVRVIVIKQIVNCLRRRVTKCLPQKLFLTNFYLIAILIVPYINFSFQNVYIMARTEINHAMEYGKQTENSWNSKLYFYEYLIGPNNVGPNFRRPKYFVGPNFRHLVKISSLRADE